MDSCTVVLEMVVHRDFDEVAPAGLDPRAGILAVEDLAEWIINTIAIDGLVSNVEVVLVVSQKAKQANADEPRRTSLVIPIGQKFS